MFTVTVVCTEGIAAVLAQTATLPPPPTSGFTSTLTFAIQTSKLTGARYSCDVVLLNGLQDVTDNVTVHFNTTSTVLDPGAQGGSPAPGAPTTSSQSGTTSAAASCRACSSGIDLICVIRLRCASEMWAWAGTAMSILLVSLLVLKYPWLFSVPLRALLACFGGACCSNGKRTESSPSPAASQQLTRRQSFIDAIAASVMLAMSQQRAQHARGRNDSEATVAHDNPLPRTAHHRSGHTPAV